jgi:hypothetical protein
MSSGLCGKLVDYFGTDKNNLCDVLVHGTVWKVLLAQDVIHAFPEGLCGIV